MKIKKFLKAAKLLKKLNSIHFELECNQQWRKEFKVTAPEYLIRKTIMFSKKEKTLKKLKKL